MKKPHLQTKLYHVTLDIVKGIAKLILFYTITFVIALAFMSLLKFIEVWIDAARHIPALPIAVLPEIFRGLSSSISFAFYLSIAAALSYSVRRKIKAPVAIIVLIVISMACTIGMHVGLQKTNNYQAETPIQSAATLGYPGLMLNQQDITIVLLEDPSLSDGSRVVSIPGQPLIYQEEPSGPGNTILPLPSAPFQRELPYFLKSIMLDFSITSRYYQSLLNEGMIPFLVYSAIICLLLCSLRFLFTISRWHLANLFLGAVVFRGILTLEIFLHTDETLTLINDFLGNRLPIQFAGAIILAGIAALVIIYSVLAYFARGRLIKDE
jgi:hypothetical protein